MAGMAGSRQERDGNLEIELAILQFWSATAGGVISGSFVPDRCLIVITGPFRALGNDGFQAFCCYYGGCDQGSFPVREEGMGLISPRTPRSLRYVVCA